ADSLTLGVTQNISGAVTQTAKITVSTLTVSTAGNVALTNTTNQVSFLASVISAGFQLVDSVALRINGNVTATGSGTISITALGITQVATSTITAAAGTVTLDGKGAALSLAGTVKTTDTTVKPSITVAEATGVTLGVIQSAGDLIIGVTQNVTGSVTQTGA